MSTVGQGSAARQGQRKGDFLAGKYLLEDCLGVGGMGEVYRATNVSLGRQVAIKVLSAEYVHIEEDVLRFLREARAAAAVRHTNVVDVFDVARDDDGTPFIVQELLSGEDLEHYLRARKGRLSPAEALEILIPVADAVAAAHAHDVVHRDLKPANIFLARDRNTITPKVLDFGACLFPTIAERSAKEVRMLIGTPHYMAPEQIVSKADVDARSDVWALGIMLFEMLVGETPFEADSADAVLRLVKTREVPPLRDRVAEAPAELGELIAACTKRDRLARLPNAGAVHERMQTVRQRLRGGPDSSRLPTLMEMPAVRTPQSSSREAVARPAHASSPREAVARPAPASSPREAVAKKQNLLSLDDLPAVNLASTPLSLPRRPGLLTLNSPGSEPPASALDELDLEFPAPMSVRDRGRSPVPPGPLPFPAEPDLLGQSVGTLTGVRELDEESGPSSLDLAARPSSWPPAPNRSEASAEMASLPPVLDPRAVTRTVPTEAAIPTKEEEAPVSAPALPSSVEPPRPPAVRAPDLSPRSDERAVWSMNETVKFVAAVALPALIGFVAVLVVPALGTPIGRALRGDSTLASGVLAVTALVCAAALCARSMLGERDRWMYVAAAGAVLFGIVMIIVTFSASEAAELGVPSAMAGLTTLIAPIAPLALALGALGKARGAWVDPYARSEAVRFAALASLMLFLTLALSPMGAVRTPPRPPQALRVILGG
jgi:serine/threonine-protein kinase